MNHVFVLRGDITHLECDAWMLPTDARYSITRGWLDELPGLRGRVDAAREARFSAGDALAQALPAHGDEPRIVLTAVPLHGVTQAAALRPALDEFFRVASEQARARNSSRHGARPVPLVALPSFGTQGGGGTMVRGPVLELLLKAATEAAAAYGVDVALVFRDPASHALAQRIRQHSSTAWRALSPELREEAERLSPLAASGRLVPFMGSGVSVSAGGADWAGLIRGLVDRLDLDPELREHLLDPTRDALDQAAAIRAFFDQKSRGESFHQAIADQLSLPRYGIAPALLAQLQAEEAITLNYDDLFERAGADVGRPRRVIPAGGPADDPAAGRWLLKLHGSVAHPDSIVLTRDDYLGFNEDRTALSSLVKATLITRHLLFVGFGLKDDHFHEILFDVRRAVRDRSGVVPKLGTVIRLVPDALDEALWGSALDFVPLGAPGDTNIPALGRQLEVFLDALLCFASDSDSYLLTPGFEEVLSDDESAVRDAVLTLEGSVSDAGRRTAGWRVLEQAIARLRSGDVGLRPSGELRGRPVR